MEIKYYCRNDKCRRAIVKEPYVYTLRVEKIMDEKNIAHMFCPHCKAELNPKQVQDAE
ncbi:MAG: hypothetical protein MI862_27775 [Desulfobacterales bacterium]|nr:hypothetical protein [Desulfobacterales bacterium]